MTTISWRYAQEKRGQKLHIVPEIGAYEMANEALCGKQVSYWRKTLNMSLGHACKNCLRVNQLNGQNRAIQIIQETLEALKHDD